MLPEIGLSVLVGTT